MKYNIDLYIFILFICIFTSCKSGDNTILNSEEKLIKIDLSLSKEGLFSSLYEKVDYLMIQDDSINFLVEPYKIIIRDSLIFINDTFYTSIFIYDKNGFFKTRINNSGRGPFEFETIDDFAIINDTIWIKDGFLKKEIAFDMDGKVLLEKKNLFSLSMYHKAHDFSLVYLNNNPDYDFRILRYGSDNSLTPYINLQDNLINKMYSDPNGFQVNKFKSIFFSLPNTNNLLEFDSLGYLLYNFRLDFGDHEFKKEIRNKIENKYHQYDYAEENHLVESITNYLVTNSGFLIYIRRSDLYKDYLYFDRKFNLIMQQRNLINDLDGLSFDNMPWTSDGDNIVYLFNSNDLYNSYIDKNNSYHRTKSNIDQLMSSGEINSKNEKFILAFFKLKNI